MKKKKKKKKMKKKKKKKKQQLGLSNVISSEYHQQLKISTSMYLFPIPYATGYGPFKVPDLKCGKVFHRDRYHATRARRTPLPGRQGTIQIALASSSEELIYIYLALLTKQGTFLNQYR